ncbi:MAG: DNA-binding protein [Candidatus Dadabacteria bacterium]|nr:MAG: DNA-binding protein [Candidatus Dadabacteria bacterium]
MASDFLTHEEVLDELMIDEQELAKLISQGELRGFRDGMTMKFKRSDVMKLKQGRNTEPTIILTESDQDLEIPESSDELLIEDSSADDTVLNISDFMDSGDDELSLGSSGDLIISSDTGSEEEAIPTLEAPSLSADDSGTIEFYDSSSDDTGALMEIAASSEHGGTESLELIDEDSGQTGALALADSGDSGEFDSALEESDEDIAPRSSVSTRAARSSRRALATAATLQKKAPHIGWTIFLLLTMIVMFLPLAITFTQMKGVEPDWVNSLANAFSGLTETVYNLFLK